MKKTEEKFHCYGENIVFSEDTCFNNECRWYVPCSIYCGKRVKMYKYVLAGVCHDLGLSFTETTDVLRYNYDITENAAKKSIIRFYNKQRG